MIRPIVCHKKVSSLPVRRWKDLRVRDVNTDDTSSKFLSFTVIELPPKVKLPLIRHSHTVETIYILEGDAKALINSKIIHLRKGDYLCFGKNVAHSFKSGAYGVKAISLYFPPINQEKPDIII